MYILIMTPLMHIMDVKDIGTLQCELFMNHSEIMEFQSRQNCCNSSQHNNYCNMNTSDGPQELITITSTVLFVTLTYQCGTDSVTGSTHTSCVCCCHSVVPSLVQLYHS